MKALKALVIFMGILIAIGVTVVGVTIYRRATDMVSADKASPAAAPSEAAPQRFGSRDLDLPPGSMIASVQTVSVAPGVERVLVHVDLPDGGARILVLDPLRGDIAGAWQLKGGSAGAGGTAPQP